MNQLQPIKANERIELLDSIRGLALLGILLVNMSIFSYPSIYLNVANIQWWDSSLDRGTQWLVAFLAEGKFYPMFSFLFGAGFMLFMTRAEQKQVNSRALYKRRAFILLGIGLIHAIFIWMGDILVTYALLSLFLLLFRNRKPSTILKWAFSLLILPALLFTLLLGASSELSNLDDQSMIQTYTLISEQALNVYSEGTYAQILTFRINELMFMYANSIVSLPTVLGMFLLGMFMIRIHVFQRMDELKSKLKRAWLISMLVGIPLSIAYATFTHSATIEILGALIGGPAMTIFYLISLTFLYKQSAVKKGLQLLAPVGRLGLTNYLLQSIICTSIFYSYGLGLYGDVSPFWTVVLALSIYVIQIFFSHLWLKRYQFGPAEWIWRKLTYK
ncbi:DUF418 domain-containing protein [Bacillus horti]|uniref:DUF418 domain-containing protein n=1 Tax=Caldalkalibacillus horti TaxID=77523 RepID=A0ABT9VW91_9BACI|nr:DUF418 domain-containing protein [Bacillus horti]MDQ0165237.1 uncharacterized protein [Bacillus horti]